MKYDIILICDDDVRDEYPHNQNDKYPHLKKYLEDEFMELVLSENGDIYPADEFFRIVNVEKFEVLEYGR